MIKHSQTFIIHKVQTKCSGSSVIGTTHHNCHIVLFCCHSFLEFCRCSALEWTDVSLHWSRVSCQQLVGKEKEHVFQNMPSGVASLGSGRISVEHHLEPCGRLWRCWKVHSRVHLPAAGKEFCSPEFRLWSRTRHRCVQVVPWAKMAKCFLLCYQSASLLPCDMPTLPSVSGQCSEFGLLKKRNMSKLHV